MVLVVQSMSLKACRAYNNGNENDDLKDAAYDLLFQRSSREKKTLAME